MSDGLLITNIGELCTLRGGVRRGAKMGDLAILENAAVAVEDGRIAAVGDRERVERAWRDDAAHVLDAGGRAVVPGFVDAHTHPVFAGERSHELAWKLQGKSYQEIADMGGGILHTVEETRRASRAELTRGLVQRLDAMLRHGTTTVEAKSGYGLDVKTEVASLEAVRDADARHPVDVVPTLLAAHAVPPEFDGADAFAEHVAEEVTPAAAGLAEFVDVFCEEGWFTVEASRRVLDAGVAEGLRPKVHADELHRSGGSRLAAEVGAVSADHLLHATREDVRGLVAAGVVPVLLPATAFTLNARAADAQMMMAEGAAVALATDFNPNCWCPSMVFAIRLGCHMMRMTPAEALSAATINGAAAVGRADTVGSIEVGKRADLVVLDAPSHVHLAYQLGTNPVRQVVKAGALVVDRAGERRLPEGTTEA